MWLVDVIVVYTAGEYTHKESEAKVWPFSLPPSKVSLSPSLLLRGVSSGPATTVVRGRREHVREVCFCSEQVLMQLPSTTLSSLSSHTHTHTLPWFFREQFAPSNIGEASLVYVYVYTCPQPTTSFSIIFTLSSVILVNAIRLPLYLLYIYFTPIRSLDAHIIYIL